MKFLLYLFISSLCCFISEAQTVSNIAAEYHDGQVFITWNNLPQADTGFYYVYKSPVPITSANIQNATYLGRVLFNFGYDYRFTFAAVDHAPRYLVTNDNPFTQLNSAQNLFVLNCTSEGAPVYFAVRTNYGSTTQNWTVIAGANATLNPVVQHLEPIRAYLAESNLEFPDAKEGETIDAYIHYGSNTAVGNYPAMTNEGCLAFHLGIVKSGNIGGKNACFIKFHGGNGDFIRNMITTHIDNSWKITFDDWMPAFGMDSVGYNTRWFGYNEGFDLYHATEDSPTPTTGVVRAYTLYRTNWELNWILKTWPTTIDTSRIYLIGSSQGCAGTFLHSMLYPGKFAAGSASDGKFNMASPNDDNPDCKYNDDNSGRTETRVMWGHEDFTNLPTDVPLIQGAGNYKIYTLTNMNNLFSANKENSLPFMVTINGKEDDNTCWEEKVGVYSSVQKYNAGGIYQWDLRGHSGSSSNSWPAISNTGMLRFKSNLTYPAFSYCALDGDPGDATNPNPPYYDGDDVGSLHGNIDWVDDAIIDAVDVWEMELFITQVTLLDGSLIPETLPEFATSSVTIRRAQNFKGFPAGTKLCWKNYHNGQVIQSGELKQQYQGSKPKSLTVKKVKVYADTSQLRIELCNPLKFTGAPTALSADDDHLYPNPFRNQLNLRFSLPAATNVEVVIFNLLGERVFQYNYGIMDETENLLDINVPECVPGIYFVKLKMGDDIKTFKVIKE